MVDLDVWMVLFLLFSALHWVSAGGGCDLRLSASFSAGIDNKSVRSSYINLWLLWVDEFSTTIWHQCGLARGQWVCE